MIKPLYTEIRETLKTDYGVVIREHYYEFPREKSNIYLIDDSGEVIWFADKAMPDDVYANQIFQKSPDAISCASWKGFTCTIDLKNGKLLNADFTK